MKHRLSCSNCNDVLFCQRTEKHSTTAQRCEYHTSERPGIDDGKVRFSIMELPKMREMSSIQLTEAEYQGYKTMRL
jgi:hypothetical protein